MSRRILHDGREILDELEWETRRRELWLRAKRRCECEESCLRHFGERCQVVLALDEEMGKETGLPVMHADHREKRGLGGGLRDDRLENLRAFCPECHGRRHLRAEEMRS